MFSVEEEEEEEFSLPGDATALSQNTPLFYLKQNFLLERFLNFLQLQFCLYSTLSDCVTSSPILLLSLLQLLAW